MKYKMEDSMCSPLERSHVFSKHVIPLASLICSSGELKTWLCTYHSVKMLSSIIQYEQ